MIIRLFCLCFSFFSFTLPAMENLSLLEAREIAKKAPVWKYPYFELFEHLRVEGKTSLPIFSYGSLMDVNSARRTLSQETVATRRAVIAYNVRRIFDRDIPIFVGSKWGQPNDPLA